MSIGRSSSKFERKDIKEQMEGLKGVSKGRGGLSPLIVFGSILILIVTVGLYFCLNSNEEEDEATNSEWLDTYRPKMTMGVQEDEWWVNYPILSPCDGAIVDHPDWVLEKLRDGPLLIFTHSEGCAPCKTQQTDISRVMKEFGSYIQLVDLLSGSSVAASDTFEVYDANGSPNYIPLTIVLTLIEDRNGNVGIGWRSAEGATGLDWLTDHAKDAIYYHRTYIEHWG